MTTEPDQQPTAPAIDMQPVKSSNLSAVGYDAATNTLAVQFKNGGVYHYAEVPADVFQQMLTAASPGGFYASAVRGQYQGVRQ